MLSEIIAGLFVFIVTIFMCVVIFAPIIGGILFAIRSGIALHAQISPDVKEFYTKVKKELKKNE